jgi:Chaperone of endosialidase
MNSIRRIGALALGLVLMLFITPSWAQTTPICSSPGCNPTTSDLNGNTAGGTGALGTFVSGVANTAFGQNALQGNTTGNNNTATGTATLFENLTGSNNTASGFQALQSNTSGDHNTASGVNALFRNTAGSKNTAVGEAALRQSTGNKNIAVGFRAGESLTNGNNNIYLDNVGGSNESQTMRLGDTQTRTFIAGIVTANVSGATVEIDGNGQLGIVTSSARYKRDIETMASRSDGLLKLRPVTFTYKADTAAAPHYGLVAEEVATVYPELVTRTASGEVQTVKYHELIPMLLNELQRQQQTLQSQAQVLQRQEQAMTEVQALRKELAELRTLVGSKLER